MLRAARGIDAGTVLSRNPNLGVEKLDKDPRRDTKVNLTSESGIVGHEQPLLYNRLWNV